MIRLSISGPVARAHEPALRAAAEAAGGLEVIALDLDGRWRGDPDAANVALLTLDLTLEKAAARELPRMLGGKQLVWLQSPGAGVDNPAFQAILGRGVRLTNASGINAEPIAQYIFTYVLHWERNVARHLAQQREHRWDLIVADDLARKTLGVVGYGAIGRAAARVAKVFGMRVIGLRRNPVSDEFADEVVAPSELHALLAEAHYVLLSTPLTRETRALISHAELAAMREDAVLINVARGGVVDEAALIATLSARGIRGATLDVTETEPLPPESPLWDLENCVITPHGAGYSPLSDERLMELFIDNLGRYARGEALRNEITSVELDSPA